MGASGAPIEPADGGLSFRVLGRIEVSDARGRVAVGGPKERMVLAHLLVRANTTVSLDTLVESVWAGEPPRSADRTMRSYVARLRKALEPARAPGADYSLLVTSGRGYRLQLGPDQFDASRFEDLARRGAAELRSGDPAAARTLREALALWSGDAYSEFADFDPFSSEARRLGELRVLAVEDRVDADLAAGAAAELVAELEGLMADHPFRERLWGQLMLALYRSGRQRDALAVYQRARSVLIDELGLEPGPELRRLEAAILDQDPGLDVSRAEAEIGAPGLPVALESVGPAFVGRDAELDWLRAAWADAARGQGRFLSLLGPEGIGKTRLAAELAREVHAEGGLVLYARCDHAHPGTRALFDQALRSAGGSLAQVDVGGQVDGLVGAVARFLPTWSQGRLVLVVLDDLHLADAGTLGGVADLAGWCAAQPMLVVGAFRTDAGAVAVGTGPPAEDAAQISLQGLAPDAVGRICALYEEADWSREDVARLHDLTDGVPLRIHEQASEWARQRAAHRVENAADRLTGARVRLAASRAEVADSVEGIGRLLEQRRAQLSGREAPLAISGLEPCPYKGLARFETADAANFFGRERLVAELVARLPGASLLAVVGPSGSGKSSLVRAGVLPALAAGVLPGTAQWRAVTMCPGAYPARELARQLRPRAPSEASDRLVIFVDQFEETFTLCTDEAERGEFVGRLVRLVDGPGTVVMLAIRADHLGRCASYPALAEQLTTNDVLVGPMRDTELRRVIEIPAQRAGLEIEPGLVEVIVADVAGRAGALPLLSTALAETWERRQHRTLTLAGYRAAGAVKGALARMAEDAYQALPAGSREAARRVLLRLCDSGETGALDFRRRLPIAEAAPEHDAEARTTLERLVERRLLTVDGDAVEVAHEALLREWPRLRTWLDEDVQGRRLHRRLGEAARSWDSNDHDSSELYRGTRLEGAADWAAGHDADLNASERAFLNASRAEAEREMEEAHRRVADKARTNRRLVGLLGGVATLLVLALTAGVLFLGQRNEAQDATRVTRVRELAGESTLALDVDPELSLLLALEAVDVSRSAGEPVQPEAIAVLQDAVQASRLELRVQAEADLVDASHDGYLLATSPRVGPATTIWNAQDGTQLRTLTGPVDPATGDSDSVSGLAFSPETPLVAVSYGTADPEAGERRRPAMILWDAATGTETSRLAGPAGAYSSPTFSPDGRLVAALGIREGSPNWVTVWDVASTTERLSFEPAGEPFSVTFHPDGQTLVVPGWTSNRVGFYSADDGREVDSLSTPGFEPVGAAIDSTGTWLALPSETSGGLQVWNLKTRKLLHTISAVFVQVVDWSPDGERLAMSNGNQGPIQVVDVESGQVVMMLRGHVTAPGVAFVGDGDRLVSVGGVEGDLRVWNVSRNGPPALGAITALVDGPFGFELSPDGAQVATITGRGGGAVEILGADSGELLRPPLTDAGWVVLSPDWRLVASLRSDAQGEIHDLRTSALVGELPACTRPKAFSPDGSLLLLDGRAVCTPTEVAPQLIDPPVGADLRNRVIDVVTGEEILDLGEQVVDGSAFNPEGRFPGGRYLALTVHGTVVEIYDVVNRELVTSLEAPTVLGVTFDPTGRWLAGGGWDGRVWVLDFAAVVNGMDPEEALVFDQVATNGVSRFALNGDGILATSGNGDGLLRLWNFQNGELLREFRTDRVDGPAIGHGAMQFSPDGSYMLYMDSAGVLRRYLLDTDELIALAETRLTRNFTVDECRRYLDSTECQ